MIRDFSSSNSHLLPVFWRESEPIVLYSLLGRHSSQMFSGMRLNEAFCQLLMTVLYRWKERMFPDWNRFLLRYWSIKSMPNDCWRHSQRVKRALALITLTISPELTLRWKKYFETAHRESNPLQSSDWTFQTLKSLVNFNFSKKFKSFGVTQLFQLQRQTDPSRPFCFGAIEREVYQPAPVPQHLQHAIISLFAVPDAHDLLLSYPWAPAAPSLGTLEHYKLWRFSYLCDHKHNSFSLTVYSLLELPLRPLSRMKNWI